MYTILCVNMFTQYTSFEKSISNSRAHICQKTTKNNRFLKGYNCTYGNGFLWNSEPKENNKYKPEEWKMSRDQIDPWFILPGPLIFADT